ncbi:tyrosine-type recombinase/integrase [Tautonia plasticadhaerens]|uniref:Site-specific tyrosine recombinase XerD n=1 Tax=Tautonia plasticadhaerens TaxID=2527974 RepID=A0A518H4G1_9BACT|nr:site-specific integrase [Tautonia plasticadhaerens]QDV35718.1 site-specific tyrosine recombinase XerD [Tautonia plasticadhaerens]
MSSRLPIRKFIKVWIKKRKNNRLKDGSRTTSYTLEWVEFGRRRFQSLGKHASATYARQAAADLEKELNAPDRRESLDPITWDDFQKKYLDTHYPGHDLPPAGRKEAERAWGKSLKSMLGERRVLKDFGRIAQPGWCHEIAGDVRETYVQKRLVEVPSADSVNADLRLLRLFFNVLEDWKHRPEDSNPFSGRGRASVGARQKRAKQRIMEAKPKHFTRQQIVALLDQADREVAERPEDWGRRRLQALVYFAAYTGARIGEVLHLEWDEIDWEAGIAWLNFKIEHDLKTEGAAAPIGLPDALIDNLRDWERHRTCRWVFPNAKQKPWVTSTPGYKPLDQLKALAGRAGIDHATWKMFRHSMTTHAKQWFGLSAEQVKSQLRHTTTETQKHYDQHDKENLRAMVRGLDFRR